MRPLRIALGDLTYFNDANIGNIYTPLAIGYLASHAKARFGPDIDVRLFKDPKSMLGHVRDARPDIIGLSAYYWQEELNKLFVRKVRAIPNYWPMVVLGGPSIDSDLAEQADYLRRHPGVDRLVVNEGEDGFAKLVGAFLGGFEPEAAITHPERVGLSTDLASVPSPYLDGTLDEFLDGPFQPMLQTSRLCPYTCLAGDTLVITPDGDIPIRELADKYGDAGVPVDTFDTETLETFVSNSVNIRRYGQDQQLVRVHFDDGTHIDCTPDHEFLQISHIRQWECEAADLHAGACVVASLTVRKAEIRKHRHYLNVVSVEYLAEKGDVYCLTVPETGWFFANNVLVKNCSFCVSGKSRGKLRTFPMEQVDAEVEFIAKRFADRPDHILYIVDENFGILGRDVEVAKSIRGAMQQQGFPKRVFYYNDKRFTQTSRDVQEVLGDACHHGVCLSLQSENPETLKAVRRRNLTDDDIRSAIAWAHGLGLVVSTELIFGMPCETRASFLALLDKCARLGFDKVQCYNLIIFDGIEMNRRAYRDEHRLVTRRRPINAHALVLDGDACAETEEVVVQSSSISFDDYRLVRAMNVMFHAVFVLGVHREFFRELVASGRSLTAFFQLMLTPTDSEDWQANRHRSFIDDLDAAIRKELGGHALHDGRVVKIQPVFANRLAQATWVPEIIARLARQQVEVAA